MTQPAKSTLPNVNWLTVEEVAAYFAVSRMTIYRWIRSGRLPAVLIGPRLYRIDEQVVKGLMTPAAVDAP